MFILLLFQVAILGSGWEIQTNGGRDVCYLDLHRKTLATSLQNERKTRER